MRNFKLTIRYDGTEFFGWQTQPGRRTVQETIERAIARDHPGGARSRELQRPDRFRPLQFTRTSSS